MVDAELRDYIHDVVTYKDLHEEIALVRRVLVGLHRYHHFTVSDKQERIKRYDQMFKALLAEKARQEVLNQMRNHKTSDTKDASTGEADNTGSGVRVGNVLKKKIAGGRQRNNDDRKKE
jgi:hypothetical protein